MNKDHSNNSNNKQQQQTNYHNMNLTRISALNYEGRPESKDRLRIKLAQVIHHVFQTWPQVIFTCSQRWKHVWVCKRFESFEEVEDAVQQWLNGLATVV